MKMETKTRILFMFLKISIFKLRNRLFAFISVCTQCKGQLTVLSHVYYKKNFFYPFKIPGTWSYKIIHMSDLALYD